jgi:hypothetical protein
MDALREKLASAINLRESQKHEEARQLLLALHSEFPEDPQVNYQCAWIHDLLGLERKVIPFYEKAMEILLNSIADTWSDEGILRYRRAIRFYSDKLDQTW